MHWIDFPDDRLTVNGLPWFSENSPEVYRLPLRLKDVVREPVWHLATMPAGARIRFRTDATAIGIRANYTESAGHGNMSLIGQMGICLYVDGRHWLSVCPAPISGSNEGPFERVLVENLEGRWREITLYLPNYVPAQVQAIGVNEGAHIESPAPFAVDKPVVYYGSSITQGGCASRSGMSYQAILSRMLNVDFVNLGFSGNGIGEVEVAEAVAEVDAACYVLEYGQNVREPDDLVEIYPRFIETIRKKRPDTPMICVTPIYATPEIWSPGDRWDRMRKHTRDAVARRVAEGDPIRLVEGYSVLGPDVADGFADAVHPNDVGFSAMAHNLAPTVAEMIGLTGERMPRP